MICSPEVINRVKRASGQLIGILKMIEDNRDCNELTMQLKAAESSIRRAINLLAVNNLANKVKNEYDVDIFELEDEIKLLINR